MDCPINSSQIAVPDGRKSQFMPVVWWLLSQTDCQYGKPGGYFWTSN